MADVFQIHAGPEIIIGGYNLEAQPPKVFGTYYDTANEWGMYVLPGNEANLTEGTQPAASLQSKQAAVAWCAQILMDTPAEEQDTKIPVERICYNGQTICEPKT